MKAAAAFRGQPLLVLAGVLGAWLALRVSAWEPPADAVFIAPNLAEASPQREGGRVRRAPAPILLPPQRLAVRPARSPDRHVARASWPTRPAVAVPWLAQSPLPIAFAATSPSAGPSARPSTIRAVVGHNLLLAAGLSQMELPPALAAYLQRETPSSPGVPAAAPLLAGLPQHGLPLAGSRWSTDAWLMVRQDTTASVASGRPSYGRSQAGGVIRYRLGPSSGHSPQVYARASSALAGPLERDLVAGLSGRPAPRIPLRVGLEARVSQTGRGTELRPAAIAVTEFPPVSLPRGLRAEAYVQGGYVGGDFATAFVDGQGRVERTVARTSGAEVSAGVGAWGGAQKGATRLDIGPTAAVSFRLGPKSSRARGRVAADYRLRVAGDAEPRSGPALTLSAGF